MVTRIKLTSRSAIDRSMYSKAWYLVPYYSVVTSSSKRVTFFGLGHRLPGDKFKHIEHGQEAE